MKDFSLLFVFFALTSIQSPLPHLHQFSPWITVFTSTQIVILFIEYQITSMRKQVKSTLLIIAVSFIIFAGCKKHCDDDFPITIVQISTAFDDKSGYTETGTFTTSGRIQTSGTFVMSVTFAADSFYCTNKLVAPDGTFTTDMK